MLTTLNSAVRHERARVDRLSGEAVRVVAINGLTLLVEPATTPRREGEDVWKG